MLVFSFKMDMAWHKENDNSYVVQGPSSVLFKHDNNNQLIRIAGLVPDAYNGPATQIIFRKLPTKHNIFGPEILLLKPDAKYCAKSNYSSLLFE